MSEGVERVSAQVTTTVIQDEAHWDAIRDHWNELHAASPTASTPLDHTWLRNWWRVYQPSLRAASLRVITVWRRARLIGALPLFIHRDRNSWLVIRHLRMMSTGEAEFEETCPDYLDLLSLSGEEAVCADSVWRAIDEMTWDHLELLNLAEGTALTRPGIVPTSARRFSLGACPIADLAGGFESYLHKLSSNGRQQARRLLREAEAAGARLDILGTNQLAGGFNDLVRLHQARWTRDGRPGVFSAPRFVEFHRSLLAQWLPVGRAVLARLTLGSEPVAVLYGFVSGSTFEFYQSGVRIEAAGPLRSPGNLSHLLLMKALSERRVTAYDFLRGSSPYKKRLATRENQLSGIEIWRPSPRASVYRVPRRVGRIAGSLVRPLRRPDWLRAISSGVCRRPSPGLFTRLMR
jgi:CelD/BcsL family acetyltransferase involved in cellulose biosynthesis